MSYSRQRSCGTDIRAVRSSAADGRGPGTGLPGVKSDCAPSWLETLESCWRRPVPPFSHSQMYWKNESFELKSLFDVHPRYVVSQRLNERRWVGE